MYVEELIGPDTVDTFRRPLFDACVNGRVRPSLTET